MDVVNIIKYSIILILLQFALGAVVAQYFSFESALSIGSFEYLGLNYVLSFICSVTLLTFDALGLKSKVLSHLITISAIVYISGNLVTFSLLQEPLPLGLYLMDAIFSAVVVGTAWLISQVIKNARSLQHGN